MGQFKVSNAECPNPQIVESPVKLSEQCFYEPKTVQMEKSIDVPGPTIEKNMVMDEEIWVKKDFSRKVEECKVVPIAEECHTEIFRECKAVFRKGKCVDVSEKMNCRIETVCEEMCPNEGNKKEQPNYSGGPPRQSRLNRKFDFSGHTWAWNFFHGGGSGDSTT